jgi:hypothetical protein
MQMKSHFRPNRLPDWLAMKVMQLEPLALSPVEALRRVSRYGLPELHHGFLGQADAFGLVQWDDGSTPNWAVIYRRGVCVQALHHAIQFAAVLGLDWPYIAAASAYGYTEYPDSVIAVFAPNTTELADTRLLESN